MRTLKSLLFSILAVIVLTGTSTATQVRGRLVDANGQGLNAGRIEFVLGNCPTESGPATLLSGGNLSNYGPYPIKAGPGGTIVGQIVGSDQILCGGGLNTFWQVSGYNGNTLVWTKAAIITGGLWQADTGPFLSVSPTALPPNPVLQNPISDQIITVPAGKKLQVTGTFIASLSGNATTATSLAANGTNCAAGSYALGVDASGNAEGCTPSTTITGTANQVIASASSGAITLSLPQSIATSSSPTFAGLTLNGSLAFSTNAFLQTDAANVLALRNGVNPQTFNIYNTFTDAANFERLTIGWNAGNSVFAIDAGSSGTGTARSLFIRTGNVSRWNFAATGGLSAVTDNSLDFGAAGSGRPRNIFAGTSIIADNTGVATSGANFASAAFLWNSSYWNGTVPIIDTFTLKTVPGVGTNPTMALTLSHTGTPGALSVDFSGIPTFKAATVNVTSGYQVAGSALGFVNLAGAAAATQGGTGQTTYAVGDLLVGAASNTLAKIAVGAPGNCLVVTGSTWAPGSCASGVAAYGTFQNAGTVVTQRTIANFFNGLQAVDNVGSTRTDVSPVYGTAVNTVAQGNDARIVNAAQLGSANTFTALNTFNAAASVSAAINMNGAGVGLAYMDGSNGTGGTGGFLQFTNDASSVTGYSAYLSQNAFYNGTSWIQRRGVGTSSHALAVSNHKNFSFNFAPAVGTNDTAITWTEWANLNSTGFNLETGVYQISGVQISAANLSNSTTGTAGSQIVLATSPTLVTPTIGVATATSINKVAITAPAASATLTIANTKTLTANNTLTLAGTDATTITFQGTDTYVGRATTDTLTNKTIDAEGTGNNITTVNKIWFQAAGCQNGTPSAYWDFGTAGIPTPICFNGTFIQKGSIRYTAQSQKSYFHYLIPDDIKSGGTLDFKIVWGAAQASGTWQPEIDAKCTSTAGGADDAAFTAIWSAAVQTASATANAINLTSTTAITNPCTAGQWLHLSLQRIDVAGTAQADVFGVEVTYRRTE